MPTMAMTVSNSIRVNPFAALQMILMPILTRKRVARHAA